VQFVPYRLSGDATLHNVRERLASIVVKTLEQYAPGIGSLVEATQVLMPIDLEDIYGLTGGQIYHGEPALDQLFTMRPLLGWAQYRTPIAGLYLCGAGTHPGGGITAASGHNAARAILKELTR
jgi:phytoene dehydrogenase-like protein